MNLKDLSLHRDGVTQITSISTHDGGRGCREMAKFHPRWMRY